MAEEKKRKNTSVSRGQPEKKKKRTHVSKNPPSSSNEGKKRFNQKKNSSGGNNKRKRRNDGGGGKKGPRLPSSLRKELGLVNHNPGDSDEDEIDSDEGELHLNDVYEYDEQMPEEDSKKNKRFDPVENLEYELPDEFEDENVPSDDDDDDDDNVERNNKRKRDPSDQSGDEINEDDEERHARMLQGITGMPPEAFEGKKIKKNVVVSEAYPESEYNPSGDIMDGGGQINIQELLEPLQGTPSYSKIRKNMHQLDRNSNTVHAPLRKVDQEKLDREVAYKHSKKDLSKWQPLITKNREASTIFFDEDTDLGFSTVGAIASGFEPRTELEKKIASLNHDPSVVEAHKMDGAKLLELNKVSVEDVKDHQNRLAKMRSLLFRHELKAKHIKSIKSKTYHRLMKKDRLKKSSADMQMDPEAAKEQARKQEFKRAEERMTLKHKNTAKWATRILKRGLDTQDEGTRTAISEQLHQHALLTRKMNSMKDNSSSESSDGSSDEDDDDDLPAVRGQDGASKLVAKAKEKTIKAMEEDDDIPKSGVLSLPFMVRGLKKRQEAFEEDAKLVLQELNSLDQPEDTNGAVSPKVTTLSGRRSFGVARKQSDGNNKIKSKSISRDRDSDSEDDLDTEDVDAGCDRNTVSHKDVHIDPSILNEESDMGHDSLFKSFEDIVRDPGPKTTYEVSMFASNTWKKMKDENKVESSNKKTSKVVKQVLPSKDMKEVDEDSDTESGEEMVDGILSSVAKSEFKLPSQAELIHLAFAGDDVEEEFEKEKLDILNEENPEPEKPVLVPGWGQWTHIQKKKGLPSWMLEEHATAKKKREDSLKMRKDSHLKHVFISERVDKKAEKLQTKKLPFPYTSEEVFEQSMRMPIGPEFNPATSVGALIRPEVVKTPGIIIKPIEYEDVNPHDKTEDHKGRGHSQKSSGKKNKKNKGSNAKAGKKVMKSQGKQKAH